MEGRGGGWENFRWSLGLRDRKVERASRREGVVFNFNFNLHDKRWTTEEEEEEGGGAGKKGGGSREEGNFSAKVNIYFNTYQKIIMEHHVHSKIITIEFCLFSFP